MKKILSLLLVLFCFTSQAQITINIRYSAPKSGALKYIKEMTRSGWEDQKALGRYHSSSVMKKAEALRAKYHLERKAEMFSPMMPNMNRQQTIKPDSTMIVRISEIEVYPEYLKEYLEFAHNVGATSVKKEPGVICIYPMQQLRDDCQIRILEIYASQEAYQHHIKTEHFQTYKQGTLHMVKSLDLVDMRQMAPECLPLIFKKAE